MTISCLFVLIPKFVALFNNIGLGFYRIPIHPFVHLYNPPERKQGITALEIDYLGDRGLVPASLYAPVSSSVKWELSVSYKGVVRITQANIRKALRKLFQALRQQYMARWKYFNASTIYWAPTTWQMLEKQGWIRGCPVPSLQPLKMVSIATNEWMQVLQSQIQKEGEYANAHSHTEMHAHTHVYSS